VEEDINGNKKDPHAKMVEDVHGGKYDIAVAAFRCVSKLAKMVDYTYLMHQSK
jgi:hypothetical protein